MTRTYTYAEIAADYRLWMEYVDTAGVDTEAVFEAMSVQQRVAIIVEMMGTESTQVAA